jgi:tRNA splicing endonuclease
MPKTRFDIDSENFDLYFANQVSGISPQAKEGLPKDVIFKLWRGGGELNPRNTNKLNFIAKLYILWKCLRKRWWIVVEDQDNGLSVEDFVELREAIKRKDCGVPQAEGLVTSGTFITASKELSDAFAYLNHLSVSPAYNYLLKSKNKVNNKSAEYERKMAYIFKFLAHYESKKKEWVAQMSIGIPEWLVLIYLYQGKDMVGAVMYNDFYKRAYQSSSGKIKTAFGSLQQRGFIEKTGITKGATLRITALGKDFLKQIAQKYIVNC